MALDLGSKDVSQIMTKLEDTFMLDINSIINDELLKKIYYHGYSRIPIYENEPQNIVGFLLTRDLLLVKSESSLLTIKQLQSIIMRNVILMPHTTRLEPLLSFFKEAET